MWKQALDLEDAGLYSQVPQFLELVLCAKAPNAVSKYSNGGSRWRTWAMSKDGLTHSPVDHPTVVAAAEGARRHLAKPIQPKELIIEETILKLAERYNEPFISLETLPFLFITLIGYFGLIRISEVLSIVRRKQPERFHESLGITYTTALENLRKFLSPFVDKI